MTAENSVNCTRRMTGSVSGAQRGFASQPHLSCVHETARVRSAAAGAGCRPATKPPESRVAAEPAPIWMAVLQATKCQAIANGEDHAVSWDYASGRAFYTNASEETEEIQPLGISLEGGHTLAVTWMPGETAYTLEVYQ